MRHLTAAALLAAVLLGLLATVAPAEAHDTYYYSSCAKLTQVFKHGVATSASAANKQVRAGYGRPSTTKRAKKVYAENHGRLDRDQDGTACER